MLSLSQPSSRPAIPFELDSLAMARRYQAWIGDTIRPWLGQRILEIGAGLGAISEQLPIRDRLILTEPDARILERLERRVASWGHPPAIVSVGRFDLAADPIDSFEGEAIDTIVSFNVLEHIEKDREAMSKLCDLLRSSRAPGPKRVVTLVPAHSWAFGALDREFGHFRRYSFREFKTIAAEVAPGAEFFGHYLNALGLAGWFFTGRVLKRRQIGTTSIRAFEVLCPLIRPVDTWLQTLSPVPLVGQSLLAVIELPAA